ncbi:MAG: alpha/beta hydrolase [Microthrixaceae bacterium]
MEIAYRRGIGHRALCRVLDLPDPLIQRFAGDPIEVDGRVLNRNVQLMLSATARADRPGLSQGTVDQRRTELRRMSPFTMPVATEVFVTERLIPGPGGQLRLRVYRPFDTEPRPPAIVFFHGGGWVVGDLDTHDGSARVLAVASGCVVVSVDYRLAPEHPFPAAPADCLAAYAWVVANAADLGIDPDAVAVAGDSAGGNLAAVVAQQAGHTDLTPPVAQGLLYPAVDFRMQTESLDLFSDGFFLTRESMDWFRDHYLPEGSDPLDPLASPLLADDLSGLPPAWVWTAGFDPLRDEGGAYAEALRKAGVEVHHRCVDDMVHGFFNFGMVPGGMPMIESMGREFGELIRTP